MARHGTLNPAEGYRYGKAAQDLVNQNIDKNTEGVLGTALEIGGGLGTVGGVLAGTRGAVKSAPAVYATNVGKGIGIGAFGGAGYAENLEDVPSGMVMGSILGGDTSGCATSGRGRTGGSSNAALA
jgi:hypothetical protein